MLTSQNRQSARDHIRSDIEFESSINTETKIAYLHEKIDNLTEGHYALLVNTQKLLERNALTTNTRERSERPSYHHNMDLKSYTTLGRTGLRVSPLCLGAMTFGTRMGLGRR